MRAPPGAVGGKRIRVAGGAVLVLPAGEERPVRPLSPREAAVEVVDQNRRAAFHDGKVVAPEPQDDPQREVGDEQRVRVSRGRCAPADPIPMQIASSFPSSGAERASTARRSASACATEGGPA